jgi:hypothetical protein
VEARLIVADGTRKEAKVRDSTRDVHRSCHGDRLACISRLEDRELIQPRFDPIRDGVQKGRAAG